jgi:hypothetical protein
MEAFEHKEILHVMTALLHAVFFVPIEGDDGVDDSVPGGFKDQANGSWD